MKKIKPVEKVGPTNPSVLLLIKLGAIAVHVDEMIENKFRPDSFLFDKAALDTVFDDEVRAWIKAMGPLLPLKRSTR